MAIAKTAVAIKNTTHAKRADFQFMAENSLSNHPCDNQRRAILTDSSQAYVAAMAESAISYLEGFRIRAGSRRSNITASVKMIVFRVDSERRVLLKRKDH
jgi:hypothetical protein